VMLAGYLPFSTPWSKRWLKQPKATANSSCFVIHVKDETSLPVDVGNFSSGFRPLTPSSNEPTLERKYWSPLPVVTKGRFHWKAVIKMAHVLVIDDDRAVLALVSGILEAHGHLVSTAQDGLAGIKVFDREHVDLVVTDIVMPGQEGMATIGAIRRTNRTIPILAVSGSYTEGRYGSYLDAATLLGADATLAKPITVDGLMKAVDRLLTPKGTGKAKAPGPDIRSLVTSS